MTAIIAWADGREALQRAASLVEQGRLDEADRQARIALSDPELRPAAYSVLGTIRFQQKRIPPRSSVGWPAASKETAGPRPKVTAV